ncbi:UNVERIFIED_ORG: FtsP/CotA-like multicopper oxidase with cupredoxin domain [Microbispora rosea subsp. rosea]
MTLAPARLRPLLAALPLGVALLMATSACGGSDAAAPAQSAPPVSTESAAPAPADSAPAAPSEPAAPTDSAVKEITVTIAGRKVTPPPGRIEVTKGQTVRITVTSDTADEAHLHGYDKEAGLKPGTPVSIEFVADETGLFEMETHESGLQLFQLVVR